MHDVYDSVGNREREGPSTPILETSMVAEQHKPEEIEGDGERSLVETDEDVETSIRYGTTNECGQEGESD